MDTEAEVPDDFTEEDYQHLAKFLLLLHEIDQENKRKLEPHEEGKKVH